MAITPAERTTARISQHLQPAGRTDGLRGQPAGRVSGRWSGEDEPAAIEQLRRQYPRWRIWHGRVTGDYWALPPSGHPTQRELISARDIDELRQRLADAERRYDI